MERLNNWESPLHDWLLAVIKMERDPPPSDEPPKPVEPAEDLPCFLRKQAE